MPCGAIVKVERPVHPAQVGRELAILIRARLLLKIALEFPPILKMAEGK
jgi:hypothetical protein